MKARHALDENFLLSHLSWLVLFFQSVEKIIVRDFYPDLPKLEAQNEYLEALQKNDVQKLREIHIKYGPKRPTATPNICEYKL